MSPKPNEFKQYKGVDEVYGYLAHDDPFVMVLRVHIEMERVLNEMILTGRDVKAGEYAKARLTWSQKLSLACLLGFVDDKHAAPLRKLNAIRNDLAHGDEKTVTPKHEHEFWTSVSKYMRDGMLKHWAEGHDTPYDLEGPHARFRFALMLTWLSLNGDLASVKRVERVAELKLRLKVIRAMREDASLVAKFKTGALEADEKEVLDELRSLDAKDTLS